MLIAANAVKDGASDLLKWFTGAPLFVTLVVIGAFLLQAIISRTVRRGIRKAAAAAPRERLGAAKRAARTTELTNILMGERREQRAEAIGQLLQSSSRVGIWATAAMLALPKVGVDVAPILASAGVVGVALGFGAQTLVKDYLAGMFLIIEDQYGVGDMVDLGTAVGIVEEVTLRTTRLRDMSGIVWYVRNGEIIRVANRSQGWTMAVVDVPVAYDEDLERIRQIIDAIADDMDQDPAFDDELLGRPEFGGVESVSGDAVFIKIVAKAAPDKQIPLARAIREKVKLAFDKAGVRVPALVRPYPTHLPPTNPTPGV